MSCLLKSLSNRVIFWKTCNFILYENSDHPLNNKNYQNKILLDNLRVFENTNLFQKRFLKPNAFYSNINPSFWDSKFFIANFPCLKFLLTSWRKIGLYSLFEIWWFSKLLGNFFQSRNIKIQRNKGFSSISVKGEISSCYFLEKKETKK